MSRRREAGRWEPSDRAPLTAEGVPLALTTYQLVGKRERRFFAYLCTRADKEGLMVGISQKELTRRLSVDRRTLSRWIATLTKLRMLRAGQIGHELAVYTLRPPSGWIIERMTGLVSPEELEAQLGPPVTREQLDTCKAERAARRGTSGASDVPPDVPRDVPRS